MRLLPSGTTFRFPSMKVGLQGLDEARPQQQQRNADELWTESWLAHKRQQIQERPAAAEKDFANAHDLLDKLKGTYSELKGEGAASRQEEVLKTAEGLRDRLNQQIGALEGQDRMDHQKNKAKERKRRWRKKRLESLKQIHAEKMRAREVADLQVDQWRAEWMETNEKERKRQERLRKHDERIVSLERERSHLREVKTLVKTLQQLRDTRREKAKAKGKFFPEEDRIFSKKIREMEDILHNASKPFERLLEEERGLRKELAGSGIKDQKARDFESLVSIRRQWDSFVVPPGTPGGLTIPVGWITPSPPANAIWATALALDPPKNNQKN